MDLAAVAEQFKFTVTETVTDNFADKANILQGRWQGGVEKRRSRRSVPQALETQNDLKKSPQAARLAHSLMHSCAHPEAQTDWRQMA